MGKVVKALAGQRSTALANGVQIAGGAIATGGVAKHQYSKFKKSHAHHTQGLPNHPKM